MQQFGIIGYPLEHSFSAKYFTKKFNDENIDARYELYPLKSIESFDALCRQHHFTGLNVTLPYKEAIIPCLDELDDTARQIGAVNVIHFHDGKLIGYNTDTLGFMQSIQPLIQPHHRQALILGTGGAAKAVNYALRKLNIMATFVSRNHEKGITYQELTPHIFARHQIIVNCTPLGMYPQIEDCPPIPYQYITSEHLVYDVVYNPDETLFLKKAKTQGAVTRNGMSMLTGQAQAAWKIWNS